MSKIGDEMVIIIEFILLKFSGRTQNRNRELNTLKCFDLSYCRRILVIIQFGTFPPKSKAFDCTQPVRKLKMLEISAGFNSAIERYANATNTK